MIRFENVVKEYQKNKALDGVNLQVHHGEFISLVGLSGAGKTTLFKLIIGEEQIDGGKILIDDIDISHVKKSDLPYLRRKIGMVFQDIKLLPRRTAFENVAFAMEVCGHNADKIQSEVPKILELVGLLHKKDSFPEEMSGGEKQRVAIARALVCDPAVIFADEPTGNLDSKSGNIVMEILQKLNDNGHTIILVTHEMDTANHAKRIIRIKDGKIIADEAVTKRTIATPDKELVK